MNCLAIFVERSVPLLWDYSLQNSDDSFSWLRFHLQKILKKQNGISSYILNFWLKFILEFNWQFDVNTPHPFKYISIKDGPHFILRNLGSTTDMKSFLYNLGWFLFIILLLQLFFFFFSNHNLLHKTYTIFNSISSYIDWTILIMPLLIYFLSLLLNCPSQELLKLTQLANCYNFSFSHDLIQVF